MEGITVIKKVGFALVAMSFMFFVSQNTLFAEELDSSELGESESVHFIQTIDINDPSVRQVSEEEVISDYMKGQGVDYFAAVKALGINSGEKANLNCKTSWVEVTTSWKTIDSLSKAKFRMFPYAQLRQCGSYGPADVISVSSNVRHEISGGMGGVRINVKDAWKIDNRRIGARASGEIVNGLGWKLRNWSYNATVTMVGSGW